MNDPYMVSPSELPPGSIPSGSLPPGTIIDDGTVIDGGTIVPGGDWQARRFDNDGARIIWQGPMVDQGAVVVPSQVQE